MTVRLIEGQVPYTGGTAIEITADKVINLLLRAENNLLHVNDDNELYCDLQLENGIAVDDDLPVGVTTGIVNESDGRPQNGLLLHYETTSGAYAQRLYGGDGKLYFNGGTGERKLVYYADDVDELLNQLYNQLIEELTVHAGEGIEIGDGLDYSALKGPCPEGYHVPTKEEYDSILNMMNTFGLSTISDYHNYLKFPSAGYISQYNGQIESQNGYGGYWLSAKPNGNYSYQLVLNNNVSVLEEHRACGYPIRPTKDIPVIPNNDWTVLFDGSSVAVGAGIYYSPELGLISISSDGINWITITDKNLGATQVYNSGDTLSQANCGGYFQRGNNYMFPFTGPTTTDTNQVDASGYGPGMYSSDVFIYTHSNWTNPTNDDLWGGTTGIVTIHNVINNTGVLSVNGRKGHVIVADNVKIFKLEDNQDFDTAQEIFDWFDQGKYPIIYYDNNSYIFKDALQGALSFICSTPERGEDVYNDNSTLKYKAIELFYTGSSVTNISFYSWLPSVSYLDTDINYSSPYVPQYDGSPATKKYVDDNIGLRVFPFADWTDLTTGQAAYDWYKSGKLPVLLYNNILYYPFQKSGGWLMFYPLEIDHHDADSGNGQYSYFNRIRITINTTNDIVTAINASTRTPYGYRIDPNIDYQYPYMAQYDGSPVTKKYLDNRIISDSTAPASPSEGALWYDTTNDVLKSYDGTNWNTVGDDTVNINTKTFYVADNNDLTTAQAAMDWYLAGKNPIIVYDNQVYLYSGILDTSPGNITFYGCNRGTYSLPEGISFIEERLLYFSFNDHTTHQITHITRGENQIGKHLDPTRNYANPYTPQYNGSPATKKYVDDNDTVRLFTLTDRNDLTTAQAAYDWFLSGKLPVLKESGNYYYCYLYSNGWLQFTQTEFDGTIMNNEESHISKLLVTLQGDGTTVSSINHSTFLGFDYLDTNIDYSSPFIPQYNGSPATKIYVDQSGPCVPVYHLGGGNVMTSYINFDMAGGTYKVKIQGYHGTTINRTITVTASSALAGTFTSNLIEHYNYGCIVTIDPSVSTTMIIQIDSNTNFTVDDIYIEKINIQSGIITATAIQ